MAKLIETWRAGGTGRGSYTFKANSAAQVPLILQGASGQTANLLEIKNYSGATVYSVDVSGNITNIGDNYVTDELTVNNNASILGTLNVTGATVLSIMAAGATVLDSLSVSGDTILHALRATNITATSNLTVDHFVYFNRCLYLSEQGTAPTQMANKGIIYTKDASTVTELFYKDSAGNEVQMTSAGSIGGDNVWIPDDYTLGFGNTAASPDVKICWNTAQTVDGLFVGLSTAQNTMVIAEVGDIAYDFAHGAQTNPTLFIQSATQSATQWGSLTHNQTDFLLSSGGGAVRFAPATNVTATLPATGKVLIDGTTTRTGTTEVLDIDATIDTTTTTADVSVATITATRAAADTGGTTGLYISVTTGAMADTQDSYGIQVLINDAACSANTSDAIAFSAEAITADANVREIAFMQKTGWDFAFLAQDGAMQMGDATYDCSTFTMIKGAQTSDPQVQFALSADANGNFSITADTGDISLISASNIILEADSETTGSASSISADALTTGIGLSITSTSTAGGASGISYLTKIGRSGTNAQLAHTAYGLYSSVVNTNATSGTNIAGYFSASGATTANYGLIVENGNVGIGTVSPAVKLEIQGTGINLSGTGYYNFLDTDSSRGVLIGYDTSGQIGMIGAAGGFGNLAFWTHNGSAWGERVRIQNDGNVGIGTTGPTATLDIDGAAQTVTAITQRTIINNTNAITTNIGATAVYGLTVNEPNITVGTATPTNSASLYISGAATEATNNYALWIAGGKTRFDAQTAINMGGNPSDSAVLTVGWNASTMAAATTAARHFYTTGNITELANATITDIVGAYFNTFTITDGAGTETVGIVSTVYIPNAPTVGSTPTNGPYALFVDAGEVRIDGSLGDTTNRILTGFFTDLTVTNSIAGSITGNCTGTSATVTGATQASITTCANLVTVGTIGTGVWQGTTIKANYLQQAAADLGDVDINLDFSNSNAGNVTNLTIDGAYSGLTYNSLTLTAVAIGFTIAGGTTSKTLTVPLDASVSGTNTGDNAANSSTMYIGTTAHALNRASAAETLAGITLTTPDIGTPSAGTLTNCTGLPVAGITASTSTALGVGSIELGHASDTTLSRSAAGVLAVEGVVIPSISSTNTLTNKRITQRVTTTTDDATAVIDTDTCDVYELSAVANATGFTLTGTPTDGQKLLVRVKDAGVSKALTWTGFTAIGVTLPAATTAGKWHYIGCTYNLAATAWHAIAVTEQA